MKQYPSISRDPIKGSPYHVFDKLDGSNIRAEWHPKKGFWKFGSRTQLVDVQSGPLGALSIPLIQAQGEAIGAVLKGLRAQEATCFFEFFGPSSFAGVHAWEEPGFKAVLFDVTIFKKGFMSPQEFLKAFGDEVETPALLHKGNVTEDLIKMVREGNLEGMSFEGVVCKGAPLKNGYPPHMFKVKSQAWIDKVKSLYTDPKILEELL
jgi:hypothetical protein